MRRHLRRLKIGLEILTRALARACSVCNGSSGSTVPELWQGIAHGAGPESPQGFVMLEEGAMLEWIPFNTLAIEANVPNTSGIYIIEDISGRVIYVGKSLHLCERMMDHASGTSEKAACLREHEAATCTYQEWHPSQIKDKEERAIWYYKFPACNTQT